VVSGWINYDLRHDWISFNFKDMRKEKCIMQIKYQFPSIEYVLKHDLKDPFIEVFYQGMGLTLIRRDIVEKVSFKPYAYSIKKLGSKWFKSGSMFDLQFAIELADLGIKNIIDLRVFAFHLGYTGPLSKGSLNWCWFNYIHS
jgi:hypothetical protein